jgi:hypothetical protein
MHWQMEPASYPVPEIVAVVICKDGDSGAGSFQDTLIELVLPPEQELQGCTPGYWRQIQHLFAWAPTGYAPGDLYGVVFGVDDSLDLAVLQAISIGGGGERALYRHATAALLNAAARRTTLTPWPKSSRWSERLRDLNFEDAKDLFEAANEAEMPLATGMRQARRGQTCHVVSRLATATNVLMDGGWPPFLFMTGSPW